METEQRLQADTVHNESGDDETVSLGADLHQTGDQQLCKQDQGFKFQ